MRCPHCGAENPDGSKYCSDCGMRMILSTETSVAQPPPPPATAPLAEDRLICPHCGFSNPERARFCSGCGGVVRPGVSRPWATAYPSPSAVSFVPQSTRKPLIAGVLMLVNGALAVLATFVFLPSIEQQTEELGLGGYATLCGVVNLIFACGSFLGGVLAIRRRYWLLALAGSIMSMLCGAFYIGFLFGIIAIVLVAASRDEFER